MHATFFTHLFILSTLFKVLCIYLYIYKKCFYNTVLCISLLYSSLCRFINFDGNKYLKASTIVCSEACNIIVQACLKTPCTLQLHREHEWMNQAGTTYTCSQISSLYRIYIHIYIYSYVPTEEITENVDGLINQPPTACMSYTENKWFRECIQMYFNLASYPR